MQEKPVEIPKKKGKKYYDGPDFVRNIMGSSAGKISNNQILPSQKIHENWPDFVLSNLDRCWQWRVPRLSTPEAERVRQTEGDGDRIQARYA